MHENGLKCIVCKEKKFTCLCINKPSQIQKEISVCFKEEDEEKYDIDIKNSDNMSLLIEIMY